MLSCPSRRFVLETIPLRFPPFPFEFLCGTCNTSPTRTVKRTATYEGDEWWTSKERQEQKCVQTRKDNSLRSKLIICTRVAAAESFRGHVEDSQPDLERLNCFW